MNTLTAAPLAPLLDRLFQEAAAATSPTFTELSTAERERLLESKTEYRALYERLKDRWLPISRETGRLLYMLGRSSRARTIVEFGMSFGISTLYLAAALRDNGGGRLITTEFVPTKTARARQHFAQARLTDLIEIREGDALVTLRTDLPDAIGLVLLDGAKPLYPSILDLVESHLAPNALIIADNARSSPDYLARVRSAAHGYLSSPCGEDVELSMRLD